MRFHCLTALLFAIVFPSTTQAGLISGFEPGLNGWDYMGDVSIQTSVIGLAPTQAQHMAFISTMCDRNNLPVQSGCELTINEHPYSGTSSPYAGFARQFLGLPFSMSGFMDVMPPEPDGPAFPNKGESGAIKTLFFAPQTGVLSFDWNKIGDFLDAPYFSIWSTDPGSTYRLNDWLVYPSTVSYSPSGVDLCSRYYDIAPSPDCSSNSFFFNSETGWSTRSVYIPASGSYWIGFGLGEYLEGTVPSVLALDNVRFEAQVPEPYSLFLLGVGLAVLAVRKWKSTKG